MMASSWPVKPVPPPALLKALDAGYVLTAAQLEKLKQDRTTAWDLEQHDLAFAREARKYRSERQEEERVKQVNEKMAEKERNSGKAKAAKQGVLQEKREERQEREKLIEANRDRSNAEKLAKEHELFEKIQLDDRRALVRDTIKQALVGKTREDGKPERTMFNDSDRLHSWTPAPGQYEVAPYEPRAANFDNHPETKSRKPPSKAPGPGSYDPKLPPTVEYTFRGARIDAALAAGEIVSPGPAAYAVPKNDIKGGRISCHNVKDDVQVLIDKAKELPGPGDYEPVITGGVSKSLGGRVAQGPDLQEKASYKCPGPGTYNTHIDKVRRIRGGNFYQETRTTVLPKIGPGPGDYAPTRTMAQEKELARLSKQVVGIMRQKQRGEFIEVDTADPESSFITASGKPYLPVKTRPREPSAAARRSSKWAAISNDKSSTA